mmetsp:Transcript_42712/g.62769  ORF Transcript_42712/g.62769 Transcript_42712/m.62769 type:complete len:217 (-) Transcript_42712:214-864(-)
MPAPDGHSRTLPCPSKPPQAPKNPPLRPGLPQQRTTAHLPTTSTSRSLWIQKRRQKLLQRLSRMRWMRGPWRTRSRRKISRSSSSPRRPRPRVPAAAPPPPATTTATPPPPPPSAPATGRPRPPAARTSTPSPRSRSRSRRTPRSRRRTRRPSPATWPARLASCWRVGARACSSWLWRRSWGWPLCFLSNQWQRIHDDKHAHCQERSCTRFKYIAL